MGSPDAATAPAPMPMAIMRNAHEAIRGAMNEIQDCLDDNDFESAKALWTKFHRFSDLHMKMEEGRKGCNAKGFFGIVDEHADKAAKQAGLRHHHSSLYELEEDVVDVFTNAPDIQRAKEIYPLFREENEAHLKEEESILMPAIGKMKKAGVPIKKLILSDILPVLLASEDDMEFFVRFANESLQKVDTEPDKPRVRVFGHALWALASAEQWKEWDAWIKDTLTEDKYQELQKAIQAYKDEQKNKTGGSNGSATTPTKGILKTEKPKKEGFFKKMFSSKS